MYVLTNNLNFVGMTTNDALQLMHQRLDATYGQGEVDALSRMVMEEVLHYSPVDMVLRGEIEQPAFFTEKLEEIIHRLEQHEPIQHILGFAWFHGHRFAVTPATLIPRPETEQLVDLIVDQCGEQADLRVLDVGTGCGCIAIALARALKFAQISAIDISADALAVAKSNAQSLKAQVSFAHLDVLTMVEWPDQSLDIVVSNPPYICQSESADMERNVLDYEPSTALFVPDDDPLLYYRAIAHRASVSLTHHGRIYLEINHRFGKEIAQLLQQHGFVDIQVLKDSYGNDRFAIATNTAK